MKFYCTFENKTTKELRGLICTLDSDEIADVEDTRRCDGDEAARCVAAAMVLHSAYRDLDPFEWNNITPPEPVN